MKEPVLIHMRTDSLYAMLILAIQKVSITEIDARAQHKVDQQYWPARTKRLSESRASRRAPIEDHYPKRCQHTRKYRRIDSDCP
jgi:hypothetical protein